jgi:phenylacetate-CoA ligase
VTQAQARSGHEINADQARTDWLGLLQRTRGSNWQQPDTEAYWSHELDTAGAERLHELQSEKLRAAVRYAYAWIPLYRRKFDAIGLEPGDIRGIDDLQNIPITTRQDMSEDLAANPPWGSYTAVDGAAWRDRGWQIFASSGTTAQARVFRYTQFDREMWSWTNARALWSMGFRPGRDSALLAFGYGPHVWLWGVHYALNLMGIPIVTAGGLDSRGRARFVDMYQPTILACTPSYALYLGNLMLELGLDAAASSVRYLFCAGEPGYSVPATRRKLEELWQAELHEFYGCTEASPSAGGYTCPAAVQDKSIAVTHLMEDTHVWETVDPESLRTVTEGQRGLSVVTNLCSEASPQLRFLVGDFTTLNHAPCACGRTHVRAMGGFVGRADDMLNIRGVTLFPSAVEDAVRRVAEIGEEFQIVVSHDSRGMDLLTIVAEPRPEIGQDAYPAVARQIEDEIVSRCELRPHVDLRPYGTLPKTEFKAKRVKDLRIQARQRE